MAENKKSVIIYVDLIHTFEALDDAEAGRLIKHYFRYINDLNPEPPDKLTQIAFEPIKQSLKRDLIKWATKKEGYSGAGKESVKSRRLAKPQLYVLRFFSENEEFIKVGITDYSVGRRFSSSGEGGSKLGYKFEILYQYFQKQHESLTQLEIEISNKFNNDKFYPSKKFGGYMECFNICIKNELITFLTSLNVAVNRLTNLTVSDSVSVNDSVIHKQQVEKIPVLFDQETFDLITEYFNFKETKYYNQHKLINTFLKEIQSSRRIEEFKETFKYYKLFKTTTKQTVHSFNQFIGGAWNSENWKAKYESLNVAGEKTKMVR